MESIAAAYGSSSSSDEASSEDDVQSSEESDDEGAHVGAKRKRSGPQWARAFPHVDGNWPSHVRVDIPITQELRDLAKEIIEGAQEALGNAVTLVPFDELEGGEQCLHLSLSRPFVLTYDQINSFVEMLRAALKWRQRFRVTVQRVLVLVNDDKTRSFLALRVSEGEKQFLKLLRCVDQCLARFNQPTYYEDPIPHVSIASSLGEELAQLTPTKLESLLPGRKQLQQTAAPICFTASVATVHVVIGNKHYDIPLR